MRICMYACMYLKGMVYVLDKFQDFKNLRASGRLSRGRNVRKSWAVYCACKPEKGMLGQNRQLKSIRKSEDTGVLVQDLRKDC